MSSSSRPSGSGASPCAHCERRDWRFWTYRSIMAVLCLVFLAAAVSKALDMGLFIIQIKDYQIITDHRLASLTAWGFIVAEFGLGAALLLGYRPRLTLAATMLMLLFFVAVTTWAWLQGTDVDCGCFGAWSKRTPGEAAVVDVLLVAITVFAWTLAPSETSHARIKAWLVVAAALFGGLFPVARGFPVSRIWVEERPGAPIGPVTILEQDAVDVQKGTYLIALIDTDCGSCQEAVPLLNELAEATGVPDVIALCSNDPEERAGFLESFDPVFPVLQIQDADFWRLLGSGTTPRYLLVRDGLLVHAWDESLPDPLELGSF